MVGLESFTTSLFSGLRVALVKSRFRSLIHCRLTELAVLITNGPAAPMVLGSMRTAHLKLGTLGRHIMNILFFTACPIITTTLHLIHVATINNYKLEQTLKALYEDLLD
jgi:hypothetical protein